MTTRCLGLTAALILAAGCATPTPYVREGGVPWPTWPADAAPEDTPVFVRNDLLVAAPPEVVWAWLIRADLWPDWFPDCTLVHFDHGGPELGLGTKVTWHMLGADIDVEVKRFEPPTELDWEGGAGGVHAYHAWLLEPVPEGTRIVTEETERGPVPFLLRWYLRGALHDAHQHWLEGLRKVSPTGPPPPFAPASPLRAPAPQ